MRGRLSERLGELWPPLGPDVAIAHRFVRPPYGGSNQFLLALRGELQRRGLAVAPNRIGRRTRACLMNAFLFDSERIGRQRRPGCRMVHRVDGPVGLYRGSDDGTDAEVARINAALADATVFQSQFSLDASRSLGLELAAPTVIMNAVDPRIFHPGERAPLSGDRVRIVSTSWSSNPNKGAAVYEWLDRNLDLSRFDYTFVGQSPVEFERIRAVPPVGSRELAALLREQDVYLTASANDPCSNALLEALACGLPALYLDSGGHPEIVGDGGLPFTAAEEIPGQLDRLVAGYAERRAAIAIPTLAEVADRYLEVMGLGA